MPRAINTMIRNDVGFIVTVSTEGNEFGSVQYTKPGGCMFKKILRYAEQPATPQEKHDKNHV